MAKAQPQVIILTEWVMKIEGGVRKIKLPDGRFLPLQYVRSPWADDSTISRRELQLLIDELTSGATKIYIFNNVKDYVQQAKTMSTVVAAWE